MKMIILAAGTGTRLLPLTKDKPKSLIDVGDGTCLLERQLRTAMKSDLIDEVIIVTGYLSHKIEEAVKSWNLALRVTCVFNPVFNSTNNLFSLWCALPYVKDSDFVITNGDNLYRDQVFEKVAELRGVKDGIIITISHKDCYDDDDMKVLFSNQKVSRVHKDISSTEAQAESVGLAFIRGSDSRKIFEAAVIELLKDPAYLQKFWLESFNYLSRQSVSINTIEINRDWWRELDFHPDMKQIKDALFSSSK